MWTNATKKTVAARSVVSTWPAATTAIAPTATSCWPTGLTAATSTNACAMHVQCRPFARTCQALSSATVQLVSSWKITAVTVKPMSGYEFPHPVKRHSNAVFTGESSIKASTQIK